jgi:serine/threonine protein kinase
MQSEKDTVKLKVETGSVVLDGRYEVLSQIGKGGMGSVFLARQLSTGKNVAVKFISVQKIDDKVVERFKKEAGFMSSVAHPNLVTLLDYGVDENGSPFLVMDYIEGEAFSVRLKREPKLTEKELTSIFVQIAKALASLHSKKIIHRDLKPGNIVVLKDVDGEPLVKLLDLGIAKSAHTDTTESGRITETGDVIGSPAYMSPEQALGHALDARADIYSMGCMMYECLTGRLPFDGETPVQVLSKRLVDEAPPITEATVAPHLVPIAMRCLAREADQRFADCNELIAALRADVPISKKTSSLKERLRVTKTGITLVSVMLVIILIGLLSQSSLFRPETGRAYGTV